MIKGVLDDMSFRLDTLNTLQHGLTIARMRWTTAAVVATWNHDGTQVLTWHRTEDETEEKDVDMDTMQTPPRKIQNREEKHQRWKAEMDTHLLSLQKKADAMLDKIKEGSSAAAALVFDMGEDIPTSRLWTAAEAANNLLSHLSGDALQMAYSAKLLDRAKPKRVVVGRGAQGAHH